MKKFHDSFLERFSWYRIWHANSLSETIHWCLLFFFVVMILSVGFVANYDTSASPMNKSDALQYVWTPLEHNLPRRIGTASLIFNDKIWVFGPVGGLLDDAVWWSDNETDWHLATDNAAWTPRYALAATVFDGKMWISGGKGLRDQSVEDRFAVVDETITENDFPFLNDVWWSVNGVDWNLATSSAEWSPRYEHSFHSFNNKLWIGAGIGDGGFISDNWWSTDGVQWQLGKQSPLGNPVIWNGKLWNLAHGESKLYSSLDGEEWMLEKTLDTSDFFTEMFVFQDKLFLVSQLSMLSSADGKTWVSEMVAYGFPKRLPRLNSNRLFMGVAGSAVFAIANASEEIFRLDRLIPLLGNVNADKVIDVIDADIVQKHDVGLPITEFSKVRITLGCGDINKDGVTNSTDALIIQSHTQGLPVPFPVGKELCPTAQSIQLKPDFLNLVSFNVLPQDRRPANIFKEQLKKHSQILTVFTQDGGKELRWSPIENIFTLSKLEPNRGYNISINFASTFGEQTVQVVGASVTPVQPGQLKYTLRGPDKLNHLGYPYAEPHPVDVFFRSIKDKLVNVQDDAGNQYIPEFNVNTIGNMQPGKGYEVVVKEDIVFEFPVSPPLPPDWWNTAWQKRQKITFNNTTAHLNVSGASAQNLQNFPVLIKLNAPNRVDYGQTQNQGQDIRFIDAGGRPGSPVLAHEIETWNESGDSYVWVKVPQIDATNADFIWMYYGNKTAPDAQNKAGVWSNNNYRGVWHLKETSGQHQDSTSNNNHSAVVNVATRGSASGKIDGADSFTASRGHNVDIPNKASLNIPQFGRATFEAWIKPASIGKHQFVVNKKTDSGAAWELYVNSNNKVGCRVSDGQNQSKKEGTTTLSANNWYYVACAYNDQWDSDTVRVFVNGRKEAEYSPSLGVGDLSSAQPLVIGEEGDTNRGFNFNGIIDEVRLSDRERNDAWMAAQYKSMNDQFIQFD